MRTGHHSVLVTGADQKFAHLLIAALKSLRDTGALDRLDLVVLDFGLNADTLEVLRSWNAKVVEPQWPDFIPNGQRYAPHQSSACRPYLREYVPGYKVYLWFDSDAWAQDSDFVDQYIQGAEANGVAVALENGSGYVKSYRDKRWWYGNQFLAFGLQDGLRVVLKPSVNIGVLALSATAPHWEAWKSRYTTAVRRTGKLNLDQHAMHAAIFADGLGAKFLPARFNWQPVLSSPWWDPVDLCLREPIRSGERISIVHLTGPSKERRYSLLGSRADTSLQYSCISEMRGRASIVSEE